MKVTVSNNNKIGKVTFGKITRVGDIQSNDIVDIQTIYDAIHDSANTVRVSVNNGSTQNAVSLNYNDTGTINVASAVGTAGNANVTFTVNTKAVELSLGLGTEGSYVQKSGDTMTGNLNVSATLIAQNIIPTANVTYSLGTPTNRFKDLYLANSTLYIGETIISGQQGEVKTDTFNAASAILVAGINVLGKANDAYDQANAAYATANTKLAANGGSITGDLIVTGNLIVSGNSTTLNTEILVVEDADIVLLSNVTGVPALNAGIIINRGSSTNTFLRWNESTDKWGWSDNGTTFYSFDTALSAYSQANTAYSQANTAYAQANTANAQANNARTQANTAYAQANSAYAQANLAYTQANNGYAQANTANAQANNARTQANNAYAQANLAYAQANAARSDANTTFATINSTFATINSTSSTQTTNLGLAYDQANNARSQANTAYDQANTASDTANAAYTTANAAANTVATFANGTLVLSAGNLNYNNTATINVGITANGATQTNVALTVNANAITQLGTLTGLNVSGTGNITTINSSDYKIDSNSTYYILNGNAVFNNLDVKGNLAILGTTTNDTDTLLLRSSANNDGDGFIRVKRGISGIGNAEIKFNSPFNVWQTTANSNSTYYTILSTQNIVDSYVSTSIIDVPTANALRTAYNLAANTSNIANSIYATSNASYAQANAAYAQANAAYAQANNAYDTGNNAYAQANTARDTGNNAYAQANAGYAQANVARSTANSAYDQANNARSDANTTFATINTTFGTTNTNITTANTQANNAYAQANAAYLQANLAYTAANNSNLKAGGLISGTLNVTQDVIVGGNLYLSGNTTYINVTTYQVNDPLLYIAANNNLTDIVDIGLLAARNSGGTYAHTGFARDASDAKWKLFDNLPDEAHVNNIINFANATYATLVANIESQSILLNGNAVATNVTVNAAYFQANTAYDQANAAYTAANTANTNALNAYGQANSAYGQANSAYSQANNAYAQANAAYAGANTANTNALNAYSQANSAYTQANNAYAQANAAYAGANTANTNALSAYSQANTAYDQANSAYSQANNSYAQANAAYGQANTAYGQANNAYSVANAAYAQANTVFGQANGAFNQANAAYAQANSAYGQANLAYAAANTANTNAINAYGQANAAYSQANTGYGQANSAYAQANLAYGQANSAYTQANAAYSQANSAYAQANLAYSQANSAYAGANTANTNALNAYSQANAAYTAANTANTNALAAYSQANAAYIQANSAYEKANAPLTVKEIYASNSTVVNSYTNINTIQFDADSGMAVVNAASNTVTIQLNSTFKYWQINGATGLEAAGLDTVNFVAGSGITIAANNSASPKTITFTSTGGGGGGNVTSNIIALSSDSYTGNGSQTVYVLSNSATLSNGVFVFVDGTVQVPTVDYTVSGSLLTFTSPPENGGVIEVRSLYTTASLDLANNSTQANAAYDQANAAYTQANSARSQANTAYGQANAAYSQANSAYSQANSAYDQANSAYAAANTANTNALNAYAQANSAYGQANLAYTQANNAYTAANNSNLKSGGLITGTLNVSQDVIVGGNLYLSGNTTYINVTTYQVNDPLIYLAANNYLTDSVDIGLIGGKNTGGTYSHTGLARDASDAKWKLFDNLPDEAHVNNVINFANSTYATLVANVEAQSILLNGNAVATNVTVNAAYFQANTAYDQANAAYTQGNNAYAGANTANTNALNAYGQANLAYTAANSAANTVRVSQNSGSTLSAKQLNFVNTANVTITVTDAGDGNANVAIFSSGGGGGGTNITVKNNGSTLTTTASSFDFVGSALNTIAVGNAVTVTLNTYGLSNTTIKSTSYTAVNAAANLTYNLPVSPLNTAYIFVIKNGVVLTPNTDYTLSSNVLTVIESGATGDAIEVRYFDQVNVLEYPNTKIEVTTNTLASNANTFYLPSNVASISRLSVAKNGLVLAPNTHFTVSGNTVTLDSTAQANDVLVFTHIRDLGALESSSGLTQYTYNTNTVAVQTIDSWSTSTYRSGKYQIQVESGTGYYATEIMILHDDATTNTVQYGTTSFGSNVGVFSTDISAGNVRLLFTATDETSFVTYNRVLLSKRSSETLPTDLLTGNTTYDLLLTLPFNPTDLN